MKVGADPKENKHCLVSNGVKSTCHIRNSAQCLSKGVPLSSNKGMWVTSVVK